MSGKQRRRLSGELEARVLATLWGDDVAMSVQDVMDRLDGDVVYTTVAKVLDRLLDKGAVTRVAAGRSFVYRPVSDESTFVAGQVRGLLERAGDRSAALQGLIAGLDPADSDELVRLLGEATRRRGTAG